MKISNREIGQNYRPYIIAEMSNNHLRDINRAKSIIRQAKMSGVDAIKIQTYTADSLTIECENDDFLIQESLWKGQSYYNLYNEISAPLSWTKSLFEFASQEGITLFSSPFDLKSIDILESNNCPAYKVASFESQDPMFLKALCDTGKPLIISTGVSTWEQVLETSHWLKKYGCRDYALLHCISAYPADTKDMNLNVLTEFAKLSNIFGLSDHSLPNIASVGAVALGASIIEKHFTLSRSDGGPDAAFSLEPKEMKSLVDETNAIWEAKGHSEALNISKRKGAEHARSIYIVKAMMKGETLTEDNVRVIRPGHGLAPKHYGEVLGKPIKKDCPAGTRLSWELIANG